jgi:hypothetical protein
MPDVVANDVLVPTVEDDGRQFVVRVYNTGQERVARCVATNSPAERCVFPVRRSGPRQENATVEKNES